MHRYKSADLAIAMIAVIAAVLAAVLPWLDPTLRLLLALPLIVFLPGYAVTRALTPVTSIGWLERVVLAMGTSLALAALGGILLHALPPGINAATWTILLVMVTVVGIGIAEWRRDRDRTIVGVPAIVDADTPASREPTGRRVAQPSRRAVINGFGFLVAFVIVVAAFNVAIQGVEDQPRPGFAQLWLLPTDDPQAVSVGIHNAEGRTIEVQLTLTLGAVVPSEWSTITLEDGETWERIVQVPGFSSAASPLEATLTRLHAPDAVYRRATLWPT